MKKQKRSSVVKKLDRFFSKYIRLRDSDDMGYGKCCTCPKILFWKESHAGHFISRGNKLIRWDERNVHLQCPGCNTYRAGEQAEYLLFLENKYGREIVDELMKKKRDWNGVGGPSIHEMRDMIEEYKEKVKALDKG